MAKLIKAIRTIEADKEYFSATLANLGEYLLIVKPSASGTNRAEVNNSIISNIEMEKLVLNRTYTSVGRIKGTAMEVDIISPTIMGSLPPTKLTTKGDPRPVDIPVNKTIGRAIAGATIQEMEYITKGSIINFSNVNSSNIFGLVKVVIRSLASNLRRFRNKSPPRRTKRYGDKICPIAENIMPLNIESGITIISIPRALSLLVN